MTDDTHAKPNSETSKTISHEEYSLLMDTLKKMKLPKVSTSTAGANKEHAINQLRITAADEGTSTASVINNCSVVNALHVVPWVIDSGATDHICNNLKLFDSIHDMKPVTVRLPNGSSVVATMAGHIRLSDDLFLRDVLYLPAFNLNLVSIPKLTQGDRCQVLLMLVVSSRTTH